LRTEQRFAILLVRRMTPSTAPRGYQFSLRMLFLLPIFVGCYMLAVRYLTPPAESLSWRLTLPLLMFVAVATLITQTVEFFVRIALAIWWCVRWLIRLGSAPPRSVEQDFPQTAGDDQLPAGAKVVRKNP
jgi:hypothetical protein